ncbi:hypothetical protein BFJ68_g18004 [Fusarium oxysporum]|uniref:Uncharacterized protein n=1 Tax=Fusarium oxysporum TaxID=5507 RepID=A0A420N9L4_FUSOX|nr:hypothetical protein BFJ68_g18004 [Fusarium oxysporum]
MCLCHGGSAYGSIVSIRAITPSWANGLVWSGMGGQTKPYQMLT